MQLAFVLYKYFPYGGLQRDFLRIAKACQQKGHTIRVYCIHWQGDKPEGFEIIQSPVKALSRHRRNEKFSAWLAEQLTQQPADQVIGFNKMPGLDVYYAADFCYEDMAQHLRSRWYRLGARYRHFSAYENAVFGQQSSCKILSISNSEKALFQQYYHTADERFYDLPPGIARDRQAPANAGEIRAAFRQQLGLNDDDLLLLQVGSGFKTKGLDRSLMALAAMPETLKQRLQLIVIGQDNSQPFIQQAKRLGVLSQIKFLGGRDDVPSFLLAADLLIHPAYKESAGMVLLEALVAGLPVLTTASCGYAHYIQQAHCGVVSAQPFLQESFNAALQAALESPKQRQHWSANALAYSQTADLYSMPEYAAEIICADTFIP